MTPAELIGRFGEQQMLAFALVLARIAPLFVFAPLFSSKTLPGRVRTFVAALEGFFDKMKVAA